VADVVLVRVAADADIVTARQVGRQMADELGFSATDSTLLATAISEIARNITNYAGSGEVRISIVERAGRVGIEVVASDEGPGIADVERALQDGYTTGSGLGLGLPGARRLMDEFTITSDAAGTTVTMRKWAVRRGG
jgi:serine/threonine-protein kinase RsbT